MHSDIQDTQAMEDAVQMLKDTNLNHAVEEGVAKIASQQILWERVEERWRQPQKLRLSPSTLFNFEAVMYFFYAIMLTYAISQSANSVTHFYWREQVKADLPLDEISGIEEWWTWMEEKFVPATFKSMDSHGLISSSRQILSTPVVVRQIRVLPTHNCLWSTTPYNQTVKCYPPYDYGDIDTSPHAGTNWTSEFGFSGYDGISRQLMGYEAGGHVFFPGGTDPIKATVSDALEDLERLKSNEWLDGATRVVTLEYGLFSPNEDSFMMVIVLFDFSTVGAAQPEISITTTPRTFEQRSTGSIFELMNYALIIWIGFFLLHIIIRLGILFNNSYFLHNHLRKEEQLYYTHLKNEILQKISSRSSGPESEEDEPKIQQIRKMCDTRRIMRATWCATESSKIDSKRSLWDALKNHTLKPYFSNAWNAIESLLIISTSSFLYYAWSPPIDRPLNPINTTVAELWDSYFYVQLAIFCGSISVIFTWFKFTHYMTIMHDSFGVLILSLGAMLADICYFFLLLTVIITGYSTALDIIYAGIDDRWSSFTFAFLNNLLTALGQTQEAESNSMYPWGMNFSLVAGDIIISIYLLTTGITLINLLIALLTATYEKVAEQSTACWRMSKGVPEITVL
eukprot:TRINITY_DN3447_c0_g2_i1.p1 TRINITY_DN3447_c0_g2~~TRINITY_DN3447_c0_g2_i1.p1  ORF type:complete len:625 (-),score=110.42 TRINITY_DN3447_c0_g2_i1:218-2092(-)